MSAVSAKREPSASPDPVDMLVAPSAAHNLEDVAAADSECESHSAASYAPEPDESEGSEYGAIQKRKTTKPKAKRERKKKTKVPAPAHAKDGDEHSETEYPSPPPSPKKRKAPTKPKAEPKTKARKTSAKSAPESNDDHNDSGMLDGRTLLVQDVIARGVEAALHNFTEVMEATGLTAKQIRNYIGKGRPLRSQLDKVAHNI